MLKNCIQREAEESYQACKKAYDIAMAKHRAVCEQIKAMTEAGKVESGMATELLRLSVAIDISAQSLQSAILRLIFLIYEEIEK
jgi:hypothetical protein